MLCATWIVTTVTVSYGQGKPFYLKHLRVTTLVPESVCNVWPLLFSPLKRHSFKLSGARRCKSNGVTGPRNPFRESLVANNLILSRAIAYLKQTEGGITHPGDFFPSTLPGVLPPFKKKSCTVAFPWQISRLGGTWVTSPANKKKKVQRGKVDHAEEKKARGFSRPLRGGGQPLSDPRASMTDVNGVRAVLAAPRTRTHWKAARSSDAPPRRLRVVGVQLVPPRGNKNFGHP